MNTEVRKPKPSEHRKILLIQNSLCITEYLKKLFLTNLAREGVKDNNIHFCYEISSSDEIFINLYMRNCFTEEIVGKICLALLIAKIEP